MIIFINFYWLINDWKILCSSFLCLCSNYRQERKTILCVSKLRRLHIKVRSFPFSKIRICESAILYRFINQLCLQYVCTYEYKKTYPICTRIHDISNNILDRINLNPNPDVTGNTPQFILIHFTFQFQVQLLYFHFLINVS